MDQTKRIAMWSGPRNLSTAMMYSFGGRADCTVVDEPFYAAYLAMTGIVHPMQDQVLASQFQNPEVVSRQLLAAVDTPVFYQKHMTQHMVDGIPLDWMADVTNVFLIRHPARVVASYAKKREGPQLDDIGFRQQAELFDHVSALGQTPFVIDSYDIRRDPEGMMHKLCAALDLPWDEGMLRWPSGGHASDGVWASHWYGAVHASTGFADVEGDLPLLDTGCAEVAAQAMPYYDRLVQFKL
ncbi:MAG: hypothetical protein ACNYPE_17005 [Candidatus Azotimanducaceae bacterium WSBS_2022_MAG_OTU7]